MDKIEILQEKLAREKDKKAKAERNIKKLEDQIKQAQFSQVSAMMEEYNVDIPTLTELLKKHNNINNVVQQYEE